ncbi:MAG: hypothetical protein VX278_10765 [Myxococcota bacterium]|nr:hypothetical protein [Myxococcota bacterium]
MGVKKYIAKAIWGKLTVKDQAVVAWTLVRRGKVAAVKEATKRATKNTLSL